MEEYENLFNDWLEKFKQDVNDLRPDDNEDYGIEFLKQIDSEDDN